MHEAWDPRSPVGDEVTADTLARKACLDYGHWKPHHLDDARALLAADPALARANLHVASAVGDVDAVTGFLAGGGDANAKGGPFPWPPLMYACYSRFDGPGTLAVARALLAAGADPNPGFLWCGYTPGFTALTGAFGEGEDGHNMPPHPARDALARALLEAGADPNDEQTLYNRHFFPDDGHLALLFEFGLSNPAMLSEELWAAARKNYGARVVLLCEHGAPVDTPGRRDGRRPVEGAYMFGNSSLVRYLVAQGAGPPKPTSTEEFSAACVAGRRDVALARITERDALSPRAQNELVRRAVEANHPEGVRLMAELGFPLDLVTRNTPLHDAAWSGDLAMVKLLVELGASTTARDPEHNGTPCDWAAHNHQLHVVAYLDAI